MDGWHIFGEGLKLLLLLPVIAVVAVIMRDMVYEEWYCKIGSPKCRRKHGGQ